jgi:ribosome-associated toxin RatA of RatAB toxin-antitoxin module
VPRIQRSAEVPYSAEQMFELVNDVASYPKFLPWCRDARVLASGDGWVRARVAMAKGALQHAFTTRNKLEWGRRIRISLEDGPFKRLEGDWHFEPIRRGSRVSLDLEFEFAGRMFSAVLGPIFNQIASTLVDSFVRRAHDVYGRPR